VANTNLKVTIDAEAAKLEREIGRTIRSMDKLDAEIAKGNRQAQAFQKQLDDRTAKALEKVGRGMLAFGAATLAGLGLATKAAIDWESAWAGVVKTVDGSEAELQQLESDLRDLATTLPATHQEIAAVAEVAGQLGISVNDVAAFTEVMINLGETTNLSATEAATALAQLMNVMGTAPADVERLGSTIVDLGNNSATTERDIVEMAQRIAGAGATIGLTEADVLAFSTALASVGIEAAAGGTAISRVMVDIASAVAEGGDSLESFAEVAGVSGQEFARAFEEDPARAIQMFVEGLGRVEESGGNVFATLEELGLSEVRVRDALLRLSQGSDILASSLDRSGEAWEANTALIEEARQRYDTAEAKIQIAKNTLVDLAIDVGNVLLPVLVGLVEAGADLLKWFGDLPGPAKTAVTILAGLAGVASLVVGSFLLMAPRISAARTELSLLIPAAGRAAGAMRALTLAIPVVGALLAVAGGIMAIKSAAEDSGPPVSDATAALIDLSNGVENELIQNVLDAAGAMDVLTAAEDTVSGSSGGAAAGILNLGNRIRGTNDASDEFRDNMESIDAALAQMVQGGNIDLADQSVQALVESLGLEGDQVDRLLQMLPNYNSALQEVDNQQRITEESIESIDNELVNLATQFGLTGDDAEKAAQEMLDSWSEASAEFINIVGAYDDVLADKEAAERETAQETADATEDASDSWEDYVGDVSVSVDEYLDELERQVKAQQDWQENMIILAGRVSAGTLDELARLGPEGAPLVAELVDASDEELDRLDAVFGANAEAAGDEFARKLADAQPELTRIARTMGEDVAVKIAREMIKNGGTVQEAANRLGIRMDKGVGVDKTREVEFEARALKIAAANRKFNNVAKKKRTAKIKATDSGTASVITRLNNAARDRIANIYARLRDETGGYLGRIHTGGRITSSGVRRFHDGGRVERFHTGGRPSLGAHERQAILQTGEHVLNRRQAAALDVFTSAMRLPSQPAYAPDSGSQTVELRITGSGALYEQIKYGDRTGQLHMRTQDGTKVTVE
jgi:TP901 family phage tail tape measure protein